MKTDDVLEAIERCVSDTGSCRGCPLECKSRCQQKLLDAVRDTINSQKAEIELLKFENKKLHETNNALNYQVDVWSPNEAIKKFAERLKAELTTGAGTMRGSVLNIIDSLVKEMEEEHNEP